jgi:rhodanese-related sulfurtransferase
MTLRSLGYEHVANLDGGFTAWKEAGLPVVDHHEGM